MLKRLIEENDRPVVCGQCGRTIAPGEVYIPADDEAICRSCADGMELWQVLELLEVGSVIELFDERGKTRKI